MTHGNDELIWVYNEIDSSYLAKLNYTSLAIHDDANLKWWWSNIWNAKAPSKEKILMYHAFNGIVLTCDQLHKRGKVGPGICMICKSYDERHIAHIWS